MKITYFPHATTPDNERKVASGWNDVELSDNGRREARELWDKIKSRKFDMVFCSDLKRAIESANLTFRNVKIVKDSRLREVNYGEMTGEDSKMVESMMREHIYAPFPNGESYMDVERRVRGFLKELSQNYSVTNIALVSHRAPQLALDVILNNKSWEQAMKDDWRVKVPKEWKPGWEYTLK